MAGAVTANKSQPLDDEMFYPTDDESIDLKDMS